MTNKVNSFLFSLFCSTLLISGCGGGDSESKSVQDVGETETPVESGIQEETVTEEQTGSIDETGTKEETENVVEDGNTEVTGTVKEKDNEQATNAAIIKSINLIND